MMTRDHVLGVLSVSGAPCSVHEIAVALGVPRSEVLQVCRACGFALVSGGTVGVSDDPLEQTEAGLVVVDGGNTHPFRVLKDTLIQRFKAADKLADLMALLDSLPAQARFEFDQSAWFSAESPEIVGAVMALGLDPAVILDFDPLWK
jgi:hypothetical protein